MRTLERVFRSYMHRYKAFSDRINEILNNCDDSLYVPALLLSDDLGGVAIIPIILIAMLLDEISCSQFRKQFFLN